MASRKFAVPAGCRDAMTDLHNAHTERYNKIKTQLQQMHVNQKEDHRLIGAFMDTHHVLHGAVQQALKHGSDMPETVRDRLEAASTHAEDVHSSLVRGRRGSGIGRAVTPGGKAVGGRMAGRIVDPQTHLLKIASEIKSRYGEN